MKKMTLGLSLLVSMGLGMVGCGDSGGGGDNVCPDGTEPCDGECGKVPCDGECIDAIEPTLTSIQPGVFDVSCNAGPCHDADAPAESLDLSTVTASETNLIGVASVQIPATPRVTAGDAQASYLMNKLTGVGMKLGTTQMPQLDPDGLCQAKIDVVAEWIDLGAPVN